MATTSTSRVTIYDVAQRAGVSKSLVSLVLRGSPQVSPARREAVQQAIDELGYRPSRAAATLAGQRSNTIGVVIDDFANLWFVDLLAGLREGLAGTTFHVSVADAALNSHLAESPVHGYLSARVDGLVIAGEPRTADAAGVGVSTVVVGVRRQGVAGADLVFADEAAGSAAAVEHLAALGHQRIAFLAGDSGPALERERSYREAMAARGLTLHATPRGGTDEASGHAAAATLLADEPQVSAIIAANDLMALGAWQALREAGRSVPADVSLVGYDNSPIAATGIVDLTSVDARGAEVGRLAAQALIARIDDPTRPPTTTSVQPRLVLRGTTAPPPR
ncbi:DNA-binding LacI/PurR family transcriptional regulator [Kineosphaera limosa]|uniref:Putative LacI family transcriptional regulator n=1 Tax=Kineosphaera limosa NBRC 100340 TaxID=1184609 RepID=K6WF00_9MICO|nr:LacI family DNA-binding transcriptional regulator [Kineosphaera limosa]NYE00745.1 DNA-binding LacI/PurR family transcriptional regulator [Kineosphaera limosa]GAB97845.1 putative LacI family transcriptional regulator [Kineosphaera limosa NBRC 100340]